MNELLSKVTELSKELGKFKSENERLCGLLSKAAIDTGEMLRLGAENIRLHKDNLAILEFLGTLRDCRAGITECDGDCDKCKHYKLEYRVMKFLEARKGR